MYVRDSRVYIRGVAAWSGIHRRMFHRNLRHIICLNWCVFEFEPTVSNHRLSKYTSYYVNYNHRHIWTAAYSVVPYEYFIHLWIDCPAYGRQILRAKHDDNEQVMARDMLGVSLRDKIKIEKEKRRRSINKITDIERLGWKKNINFIK